jgi:hypothetical protein
MPKDYALRKLHSKEEKVIFCGCDAISGLLIHYLLDELFGRGEYKILHHYDCNKIGSGILMSQFLTKILLRNGSLKSLRE